jgi:mono/diheme cytochrome c family protein
VQNANLPAEELVLEHQGADFGWPYCYYDGFQHKLVLAPEYGGDGGKAVGICAQKDAPLAAFPGHWAPNDMLIYEGSQFPTAYKDGAFIAFHGSWNRAPEPQAGYNVVFQPLANGKASGPFVVFADGFAGAIKQPGQAAHRPAGLAVARDGALYIADDQGGRIWHVTFQGENKAGGIAAAAPAPAGAQASTSANPLPPEGIHPNAGAAALPIPPGSSPDQVALGERIFEGQAAGGTCAGCHGTNAKGTGMGSNLTNGRWLWGNGSIAAIKRTIAQGVPHPKNHTGAMPPMGGVQLSQANLAAVADYVWAIGHQHTN